MEPREERLVSHLIRELEERRLQYAILRNYENYPKFGNDLDIVMSKQDLPKWRELAIQVASKEGWDTVTECHHWSDAVSNHLNIEVFRFYTEDPPGMLQVDIFHGFAIFSTPLFCETELLENRSIDERGPFTHIETAKEILFKLLQINSLYRGPENADKCARYKDQILSFHEKNKNSFEIAVKQKFGSHGISAINFLRKGNFSSFGKSISKGKKRYLFKYIFHNPFKAAVSIIRRLTGHLRQYYINPCGTFITVYAGSEHLRKNIRDAMKHLNNNQVLYCWTESRSPLLFLDEKASRVMERGGIVIRWSNKPDNCSIAINNDMSASDLSKCIFKILVGRHKSIYQKY